MIVGTISSMYIAYKLIPYYNDAIWAKLSSASFVVYAAHMVFVSRYVRLFMRKVIVTDETLPFLFFEYFSVPILTITICVLLYLLTSKYFRFMLLFVNGGR